MNGERRQVLDMLAEGKITAEEAEGLLSSLDEQRPGAASHVSAPPAAVKNPRFLRIIVDNGPNAERVNVSVPFQLLRAGIKLAALIPKGLDTQINAALKESGMQIDLKSLKVEDLEEVVNQLAELTVNVDNPTEKVKIFCE